MSITVAITTVLIASITGYGIAKFKFRGRNLVFMMIMATMMIPFEAIMIPLYMVATSLRMQDSYAGLIVPFLVSAFGVFQMRQYLTTFPSEYLDASRVDGLGEFGIFWRIVFPNCAPVIATLGILSFRGQWDNLLWPLLVTQSEKMKTIPLYISKFAEEKLTDEGAMIFQSISSVVRLYMNHVKVESMKQPLAYDLYIFDMGKVVIRDIEVIDKIAFHYGFDLEQLLIDYDHYVFPLMDGTIDSKLYWSHVAHQFNIHVEGDPLTEFFNPVWNDPVVGILERLRSVGKRVVCGSNTYAPHWEWLRERGFLEVFDKTYASHEMGISKPSPQFFSKILESEGVGPDKTLFIDDYEENIITAKNMGMDAIRYAFDNVLIEFFSDLRENP